MPQNTWNISIDSSGNVATQNASPGDKITWTNNFTQPITVFNLPSCVAPQTSPAPIAVGATTRDFTVNNGTNGTYSYTYDWDEVKRAPRSGAIDVGSR